VTISVSKHREGPWTPVATNLENTGRHVWRMPKDHPYEFFVRVEAADKAGNCGTDMTASPVKVDLALPRGIITGVDPERKTAHVPARIPGKDEAPRTMHFLMGMMR
jgi:hypothetical protein